MTTQGPSKRGGSRSSAGAGHASAPAVEYLVEIVSWPDSATAAPRLQRRLNELAADGWEVVSILPTTAATSIRSLVNAHASADTTEFAVVLHRHPPAPA